MRYYPVTPVLLHIDVLFLVYFDEGKFEVYCAWFISFFQFDDKFRMEMMEVTKLISGIEERAQEIQKLNREVMKGKKK